MRVFGSKQPHQTDEDRAAAARLSAVAARFKGETTSDFTEVGPDPIGEPATDDPAVSENESDAPDNPETADEDE